MPLDTVKLRSPSLTHETMTAIDSFCIRRQGIEVSSGERLYEITSGSLQASWDSRISIKPMREDWVKDHQGKVRLQPCPPYVILECSTAKALYGQNIYGGPTHFETACKKLICLAETLLNIKLPHAERWQVRRADWAETFALPYVAIQEFFELTQTTYFPRRKMQKYGDHAIYIPGRTTTVKLYHKGPEFSTHDRKRINNAFLRNRESDFAAIPFSRREALAKRKLQALQRLANRRLRVEVEVHADKLDFDFGHKPLVAEVTADYLTNVYDYEMQRFLREGRDAMGLARTNRAVATRLRDIFGRTTGNRLHGFWCLMATSGEEVCKREYSPATFYRNRKSLQEAGVSWHNTDIQLAASRNGLPSDFSPVRLDRRRCISQVRFDNFSLVSQRSTPNPPHHPK